jgi:hypothetical protein
MRAVLAISSLHLAQHRPEARNYYQSLATTHHETASRAALDLGQDPSPEDAQILFLFSALTTFYGMLSMAIQFPRHRGRLGS